MRDPMRDLAPIDRVLDAERACCPGGMCGPIFETPLPELALNRLRDLFPGSKAAGVVEATAGRPLGYPPLQTVAAAPPHPREDAPCD